jgi:hypothetical protein
VLNRRRRLGEVREKGKEKETGRVVKEMDRREGPDENGRKVRKMKKRSVEVNVEENEGNGETHWRKQTPSYARSS